MSDNEDLAILDEERKKRRNILDKRSTDNQKKEWAQEDRAQIEAALDRYAPPVFVEPRCSICAGDYAQYRVWIEQQLIKGRSDSSIARAIPPINDQPLARRTVGKHKDKHMKLDLAIIRATLEEEAVLIGQNFEEGVKGAVTDRGMVKVLLQKGFEDVLNNISSVEVKDWIQLAKLNQEFQSGNADIQYQEAENAVRIFMAAIKTVLLSGDFVTREQGTEILEAIQTEVKVSRERDEIESAVEAYLQLEEEIIDAEVVDDSTVPPTD
jgi:hypothetical protein